MAQCSVRRCPLPLASPLLLLLLPPLPTLPTCCRPRCCKRCRHLHSLLHDSNALTLVCCNLLSKRVRLKQGLNNIFYWGAQMVAAIVFGRFLDNARGGYSVRRRAIIGFVAVELIVGASWAGAVAASYSEGLIGGGGSDNSSAVKIDFQTGGANYVGLFFLYVTWGGCDALVQASNDCYLVDCRLAS